MNVLKSLRKEKNITQEALGKHFGIAGNTIGQYENNLREPDIATLIKLANFFNVSVDYLVGNDKGEVNNYAEENKFLNLSHLTQDQISTINTFIELSDDLKEKASIYINTLADVNKDFILKKIK